VEGELHPATRNHATRNTAHQKRMRRPTPHKATPQNAHPDDLRHRVDEDLPVPDLAGQRGDGDGAHDRIHLVPAGVGGGGGEGGGKGFGRGRAACVSCVPDWWLGCSARVAAQRCCSLTVHPPAQCSSTCHTPTHTRTRARRHAQSHPPVDYNIERSFVDQVCHGVLSAPVALTAACMGGASNIGVGGWEQCTAVECSTRGVFCQHTHLSPVPRTNQSPPNQTKPSPPAAHLPACPPP